MSLDDFGNRFGDAALKGVQGYFQGVRIHDNRQDREERRNDRATARDRATETHDYNKSRRGVTEELQNNQLETSRLGLQKLQDENEFNQTIRKDGVAALKGFMAGDTEIVNTFYNQYVPDGKTGTFVLGEDGSYRHEFIDDETGEAGTEVFDQKTMQTILERAATSDDDFIADLNRMRSSKEALKHKNATELEGQKHKNKMAQLGLTARSKTNVPAQIQTMEWMAKNLTGGDKRKAYQLAQMSKTNPQELAAKMYLAERKNVAANFGEESEDETMARVQSAVTKLQQDYQGGLLDDGTQNKTGLTQPVQPATEQGVGSQEVTLPPEAVSKLSYGKVTKFGNGQSWTLKDGKPVRVQ